MLPHREDPDIFDKYSRKLYHIGSILFFIYVFIYVLDINKMINILYTMSTIINLLILYHIKKHALLKDTPLESWVSTFEDDIKEEENCV
jgi:hypothetical protein